MPHLGRLAGGGNQEHTYVRIIFSLNNTHHKIRREARRFLSVGMGDVNNNKFLAAASSLFLTAASVPVLYHGPYTRRRNSAMAQCAPRTDNVTMFIVLHALVQDPRVENHAQAASCFRNCWAFDKDVLVFIVDPENFWAYTAHVFRHLSF